LLTLDCIVTRYLEAYLEREPTELELERAYVEANKFTLASHLYWGIWGLAQAKVSDIDYDFFQYALRRLTMYAKTKAALYALPMPFIGAASMRSLHRRHTGRTQMRQRASTPTVRIMLHISEGSFILLASSSALVLALRVLDRTRRPFLRPWPSCILSLAHVAGACTSGKQARTEPQLTLIHSPSLPLGCTG
jgi:hypothetical protein